MGQTGLGQGLQAFGHFRRRAIDGVFLHAEIGAVIAMQKRRNVLPGLFLVIVDCDVDQAPSR